VKFLLDQNLSSKLLPDLLTHYPESNHVLLLGMHKADDSEIWYYAQYHGYTLVTKNTDMVDLCVLRGAPPKVLWLRIGNCATAVARQVVERNQDRIRRFGVDDTVVLSLFTLTAVD
jgi:predicted nuclease of predicted toxin-antitoxin system